MRYSEARQILAEAIEQLDEAFEDLSDKANRSMLAQSARSRPRISTPSPVGARKGASHEEKTSSANIRTWQDHIDRLADSVKYHQSRKPGWSDSHGNVSQKDINRKVAELKKFHKHFTARQKIAVANHKAGNYEANRDHYTLTDPVGD
jgi:hypothetical protein